MKQIIEIRIRIARGSVYRNHNSAISSSVPFFAHTPLTGHQQHRVTGKQANKGEGHKGYSEEGREHYSKFFQEKGKHLSCRGSGYASNKTTLSMHEEKGRAAEPGLLRCMPDLLQVNTVENMATERIDLEIDYFLSNRLEDH